MPRPPQLIVNISLFLIPLVLLFHTAAVMGVIWHLIQGSPLQVVVLWLLGAGSTLVLFGGLIGMGLLPAAEGS